MKSIRYTVMAILIVLVSAAGFLNAARAEADDYRNYGQIRFGLNDFSGDLEDADYDAGANLAVAYGRYLAPHLILEAAVDLFGTEKEVGGSTAIAGSYNREDFIAVVAILSTIKGELPAGPLTFFGGGGVGLYLLAWNSEISTTNFGEYDKSEGDSVFGLHAVAGVNYDITPRVFAGFQGLYRWTDDIDIYQTIGVVPVRLEGDLNGYTLTLTAGFRF